MLHKSQGDTVYTYRFDWDDEPAYSLVNLHDLLGAAHSTEINFVFGDDVTTGLPFVRSIGQRRRPRRAVRRDDGLLGQLRS